MSSIPNDRSCLALRKNLIQDLLFPLENEMGLAVKLMKGKALWSEQKRELLEETGMIAWSLECFLEDDSMDKLSRMRKYYIARNCTFAQEIHLDWWEEISFEYVDRDLFLQLCVDGEIKYSWLVTVVLRAIINNKLDELKSIFFW